MNWVWSCIKQNNTTRPQQDQSEGAKTKTDQQCRNPGSPQDPGDRTEKPALAVLITASEAEAVTASETRSVKS